MNTIQGSPEYILQQGRKALWQSLTPNAAVIFDVDDTLITLKKNENGDEEIHPIEHIKELWNNAKSMGYHLYIVTARVDPHSAVHDLTSVGITGWVSIFTRQSIDTCPWGSKAEARDHIYSRHPVVLNVGDALWDVARTDPSQPSVALLDTQPTLNCLIGNELVL